MQLPIERIIPVGSAEAIILDGRTIPLIKLASALDLPGAQLAPQMLNAAVVAAADGEIVALQVDGFGGQLDIILKPMEGSAGRNVRHRRQHPAWRWQGINCIGGPGLVTVATVSPANE